MKILGYVLDLIYPHKCVFCRKVLKDGDICNDCIKSLPYTKGDASVQKLPFIKSCVSPLFYKDAARESILRYKFFGNESYSVQYGIILADSIENNLDCGGVDVISWVPLSRKRKRKRGYNQSELIARELSRNIGIPCGETLTKVKDTPKQSGIRNRDERMKNVTGAYKAASDVSGKTVLLIDDVVTTGATLSECARTLLRAGAKEVLAAALARHED